jgi:hypothetical protein
MTVGADGSVDTVPVLVDTVPVLVDTLPVLVDTLPCPCRHAARGRHAGRQRAGRHAWDDHARRLALHDEGLRRPWSACESIGVRPIGPPRANVVFGTTVHARHGPP